MNLPGNRGSADLPFLAPNDLITNITNKKDINIVDFGDELWQNIQRERAAGKLVICMGAGLIDSWVRKKLKTIK